MTDGLRELAALSARLGRDPMLAQGGGGNVSLKADGVLWVKASGKWLARAERESIFVPVALDGVRRALAAGDDDPVAAHVLPGVDLRPSIETTLHALLPHRVVVHLHAIHTLVAAVLADGRAFASARLDGLDWRWLDYRRPGLPLTDGIAGLRRAPPVVVLANHGLLVGAESCAEAEALARDVERRLAVEARPGPPPDLEWIAKASAETGWQPPSEPRLHDVATDPASLRHAVGGPLFPDQVVFLGSRIPSYPASGPAPFQIAAGRGVLLAPNITAGQEEMLLCLALLLQRLPADARLQRLSPAEADALERWEAEDYRIKLDAARRS